MRTKLLTTSIAEALENSGHNVAVLNGDIHQNQRENTVDRLKKGFINVLVATDVAARGLDVERIKLVVNTIFLLTRKHILIELEELEGQADQEKQFYLLIKEKNIF